MFYMFGYIVIWIVFSVIINRLIAIEEGEHEASEMLPLQVLFAFCWPATAPFVIVLAAVKIIIKLIKGESK